MDGWSWWFSGARDGAQAKSDTRRGRALATSELHGGLNRLTQKRRQFTVLYAWGAPLEDAPCAVLHCVALDRLGWGNSFASGTTPSPSIGPVLGPLGSHWHWNASYCCCLCCCSQPSGPSTPPSPPRCRSHDSLAARSRAPALGSGGGAVR